MEEHIEQIYRQGKVETSKHLREAHGQIYGPEWRSRIPSGFGYEFRNWHQELHQADIQREGDDMTQETEAREVSFDRIVELLKAKGVYAYVEQTGGGTATIYAGERREGDAEGYNVWPAICGPGWFQGAGWTDGRGSLAELSIGRDDCGEKESLVIPEDATEESIAELIAKVARAPYEVSAKEAGK